MPSRQIPALSLVPAPAVPPGCPVWCTNPHPDDESHYGPYADVPALTPDGEPLLVFLERDLEKGDVITLALQTPVWELAGVLTGETTFTLDQAAVLRDTLSRLLVASGRAASGPDGSGAGAS
ncbi:hypothetical protein LO762_15665 [Actinocorallia sp. API 0066]|uniref:hypothetical protein n=1 Tax=Actinocorallia sp. API 0066 TaxID=2896846 RepID=UPI001E5F5C7E|nr:hypothetical protein [Actinocorallia sp. API 0066]MCD0450616.1 hypothetical protein [Actinocorallia sp. API 0066]